MARKNSIISATALETGVIQFKVGSDELGAIGEFEIDTNTLSETLRVRAFYHGLVQKVSDAAALPKKELVGKSAKKIAETKLAAMEAVATRLIAGEWSKRGEGGSGPVVGIIYLAFAEWAKNNATAKGATITDEKIREIYDSKSKKEHFALRGVPEIAAIMERIKSERATSATTSVDTDALLGELLG